MYISIGFLEEEQGYRSIELSVYVRLVAKTGLTCESSMYVVWNEWQSE